MKRRIRLGFADFWKCFDPADNLFTRLLRMRYEVVLDQRTPDLLISNNYSDRHHYYRCRKIWWDSEGDSPDYRECHGSLTFEPTSERNLYFPVWLLNHDINTLVDRPAVDPDRLIGAKTRHCLFLVSNPVCEYRNRAFDVFAKHGAVDSPGKVRNNMPPIGGDARDPASTVADPTLNWHDIKQRFTARYRFNIAFENKELPGYVTEKLIDPLVARVVPIYWGAEIVSELFNPDCFIHARDFPDLDALARFVHSIDEDAYRDYLMAPIFRDDRIPETLTDSYLADRLAERVELAFSEPPIGNPLHYRAKKLSAGLHRRLRTWSAPAA